MLDDRTLDDMTDYDSIMAWIHVARNKGPTIFGIVSAFCNQLCADPRDKIYGLLGLLPTDDAPIVNINYKTPLLEVYLDFCEMCIMMAGETALGTARVVDICVKLGWEMGYKSDLGVDKSKQEMLEFFGREHKQRNLLRMFYAPMFVRSIYHIDMHYHSKGGHGRR